MASIEIILRDDEGHILNQKTQKRYALRLDQGRIGESEAAVAGLKRESCADMT